ncbi:hypothetical protein DZF91_32415, partial [Actinomadura logoneensis]
MDETERLRERVDELCAALTERYGRLEAELVESGPSGDDRPLGWSGRLEVLRAFAAGVAPGDRTALARLMVDPDALDDGTANRIDLSGADAGRSVREITDALDGRILLLAPSKAEAAALLEALADRELPVLLEEVVPTAPFRRRKDNGTVEFRSMKEDAARATRAEPAPPASAADPEATVSDLGTIRMEAISDEMLADMAEKTTPHKIVTDEMLAAATASPAPDEPDHRPLDAVPDDRPLEAVPGDRPADAVPGDRPADAVPGDRPADAVPDGRPLEALARRVVVRPVGNVWREDAERELRGLQRGLLWLEQWPRDIATVERLRTEGVQRREERRAAIAALEAAIVDRRAELETARESVAEAEAERERKAAEEERVAAEAVGPRQEAERLRAEADAASAQAARAAHVADEAWTRVSAIDERAAQARFELGAARDQEQQLVGDLARAREELPAAKAETERLVAEDSTAMAEGHASYYRVRAAESAVAAVRQKMTLTQRLHVAPPPAELKKLRADLKAKVRQADDAVRRAHETKEAAERAAQHQAGLEHFLETGAERLAAAKHAQERLAAELTQLAGSREDAVETHREHARTAAEAADHATQAGAAARYAEQTARAAEERLA